MKHCIQTLLNGQDLSKEESYSLLSNLINMPLVQQAAILTLLAAKKITVDELSGARDALLAHSQLISYPLETLDIVGTGGDGLNTFNISTAASLVVASCGVAVAKHGGKSSTSNAGSTDVIEALRLPCALTPKDCISHLNSANFTYLSASVFNSLLQHFRPLRRELGIPTLFNILGPLLNPLRPKRQVLGVYKPDLMPTLIEVLKSSGTSHALVLHAEDGLDELSIHAPTQVMALRNGTITAYRITPEELGLKSASLESIQGKDAAYNAKLIQGIFAGTVTGAPRDIVLLNSAAGLLVADKVTSLHQGIAMADHALRTGKTHAFLKQLQELT